MRVLAILALLPLLQIRTPQDETEKIVQAELSKLQGSSQEAYRAVTRLANLGAGALPYIKKAADGADARAKRLLAVAEEEIHAAEKLKEAYAMPQRYTLKGENRAILDYLNELKAESKENIDFSEIIEGGTYDESATLTLEKVTFHEALDAICKAGKLKLTQETGGYEIAAGGYVDGPKFFFRNFLITLDLLEHVRTVDFSKSGTRTVSLTFCLWWDGAVKPVRFEGSVEFLEAVDDKGKNLILSKELQDEENGPEYVEFGEDEETGGDALKIGGLTGGSVVGQLAAPTPGSTKIVTLRGTLDVTFAGASDVYVFDKVAPNAEREGPEYKIKLKSLSPPEWGDYGANLIFSSKSMKARALGEDRPVELSLKMKDGRVMSGQGSSTKAKPGEAEFQVDFYTYSGGSFTLRESGEGGQQDRVESLTISIAKEVVRKKIPFEFTNIELKK